MCDATFSSAGTPIMQKRRSEATAMDTGTKDVKERALWLAVCVLTTALLL